LGAANTYNGDTTINGGLLQLNAAGALPANTNVTIASTGELDLNSRSATVQSLKGSGIVTNSSGTQATLTIGNASYSGTDTFAGVITQSSGNQAMVVTKTGPSTVILTGASTYTGATNINGGRFQLDGSLANTPVTVAAGAVLAGTGTIGVTNNAMTTSGGGSVTVTAGAGTVVTNAGGTIDLSGNGISTFTINGNSGATALTMGTATSGSYTNLSLDTSNNAIDQINVGNNAKVTINGSATSGLAINLVGTGTSVLANGIYNIINFGSGAGAGSVLGTLGQPANGVFIGTDTSNAGVASSTSFNVTSTALQLIVGLTSSNYYWNGTSDNTWNKTAGGTNWLNAPAGTDPGTLPGVADTVFFNATSANIGNLSTVLGASFSINGIRFGQGNNTPPNSVSIDLGNNNLTLNAGGIVQAVGSATNTIATSGTGSIVLLFNQTWENDSSNDLDVTAPVSGNAGLIFNGTGAGKVVLSGNNTWVGGTTLNGPAANVLLQLGSATALGDAGNALNVNSGILDMNGQNATVGSLVSTASTPTNAVITNKNQGTTSVLTVNSSITALYQGQINDNGTGKVALVKTGAGIQILSTAAAPATPNSFSGGTTINGGTLQIGNGSAVSESTSGAAGTVGLLGSGSVTLNTGGTLSLNGAANTQFNIPNSIILGGGSLVNNNGLQHIGNAAGVTTGTVTVGANGGTLQIFSTATANQSDMFVDAPLVGSGPLNVAGGSSNAQFVRLTNANGGAFGSNTYTGIFTIGNQGNAIVRVDNSTALAGAQVVNFGATGNAIQFGVTSASFGSLAGTNNFALSSGSSGVALTVGVNGINTTYTGVISGTNAGTNLIKTGSGSMTLNATNTFGIAGTPGLTVSQGTVYTNNAAGFGVGQLVLGDANSAGSPMSAIISNGNVTVANAIVVTSAATAGSGTATIGSLAANGVFSGAISLNKDLTVSTSIGNTTTIQTGGITAGTAATYTVNYVGPGSGTISAVIADGVAGGKVAVSLNDTNTPTNSLTLSGLNTYSGATTVNSGILILGVANAFSANSGVVMANFTGATLSMNQLSASVGSISGGGNLGGNITGATGGTAANVVLTTGNDNTSTTYAGALINGSATSLGLTKIGTGALELTGTGAATSTYTGPTNVNAGQLLINGTITGATVTTVAASGTLGGSGTTAGAVTVNGNLTPGGTVTAGAYVDTIGTLTVGALTLNSASNYNVVLGTGGFNHGAPGISDSVNASTGNLAIAAGAILNLTNNANANGQGNWGSGGSYKLVGYGGSASVGTGVFGTNVNIGGTPATVTPIDANSEVLKSANLPANVRGLVLSNDTTSKGVFLDVYVTTTAGTIAPNPLSLGNYHQGASGGSAMVGITITNAGSSIYSDTLSASFGSVSGGFVATGSITGLQGGSSDSTSMQIGIDTTTLGTKTSGTVQVNFTSTPIAGSPFAGDAPLSLPSQVLTVSPAGVVYSGHGIWAKSSSGSWGVNSLSATNGNWTTNGSALAGDDSNAALPGVDGADSVDDTAVFGSNLGSGTVSLDGAAPSINQLTFNGGTTGTLAQGTGSTGVTMRNNSTATAPVVTVTGNSQATISAPMALANDTTFNTVAATDKLTVSGVISGSGALNKTGSGTVALGGVNTYQGATNVSAGVLQVGVAGVGSTAAASTVAVTSATFTSANTGSGVNSSNTPVTNQKVLTVAPTLAGSGTVNGPVVIGTNTSTVGILSPGDNGGVATGKITMASLTLNAGSQIQLTINSTLNHDAGFNVNGATTALTYLNTNPTAYTNFWKTPNGSYDSVFVTGATNLNSTGTANYPAIYVTGNTSTIAAGDIFKLLDWATVGTADSLKGSGNLSVNDLVLPTLNVGLSYDTSAFTTYGVVAVVNVVPEPGRVMLFLIGLLALGLRRRRRE